MNELKLSLKNFQSISEGELIFKTGLNFIVGQSNSGKTATFRALKTCLSNILNSQRFIKKGTSKSVVVLEYNGNNITWKRTESESSYNINGEEFRKTGKSDAFKILDSNTGFVKDSNDVIMNIEEELQLPFPFGLAKTDLFKLYENVFCISDSAVILKEAKSHEDSVKNEINLLDLDVQKNNRKIEALNALKEEVDVELLKHYIKFLKEKEERVKFLLEGKDVISKAVKIDKAGLSIEDREFTNLIEDYKSCCYTQKLIKKLKFLSVIGKNLQALEMGTDDKLNEYKELCRVKKEIKVLKEINKVKVEDKSFEDYIDSYMNLLFLHDTVQNLKKLSKIKVEEVSFENKMNELQELKKTKLVLLNIERRKEELERELEKVQNTEKEIASKLKEFKVCPLCHHTLEEE